MATPHSSQNGEPQGSKHSSLAAERERLRLDFLGFACDAGCDLPQHRAPTQPRREEIYNHTSLWRPATARARARAHWSEGRSVM